MRLSVLLLLGALTACASQRLHHHQLHHQSQRPHHHLTHFYQSPHQRLHQLHYWLLCVNYHFVYDFLHLHLLLHQLLHQLQLL